MNHKLANINPEEVLARFKANQPVNLRQLTVELGLGYDVVCGWKSLSGSLRRTADLLGGFDPLAAALRAGRLDKAVTGPMSM